MADFGNNQSILKNKSNDLTDFKNEEVQLHHIRIKLTLSSDRALFVYHVPVRSYGCVAISEKIKDFKKQKELKKRL